MSLVNLNLNDFPDTIPPIPGGIYTWDILSCVVKPSKKAETGEDPGGTNLVVEFAINQQHGELAGRKRTEYISTKMGTRIRRLWKSAGLEIPSSGGIDTSQLVGRSVRASVRVSTYIPQGSVSPKEVSNIDEFLIPGDGGYAVG